MTPQEAQIIIGNIPIKPEVLDDCYDITEYQEAKAMAIQALGQTTWIPVSERLPKIHQNVLLSLRSLDIEVGFRAETEPYFYCHGTDGCYIDSQNVIAWMPLPQPYKTESEDK